MRGLLAPAMRQHRLLDFLRSKNDHTRNPISQVRSLYPNCDWKEPVSTCHEQVFEMQGKHDINAVQNQSIYERISRPFTSRSVYASLHSRIRWPVFNSTFITAPFLIFDYDECLMINDEGWMTTVVTAKKTRQNRSPNSEFGAVISKKTRLNRSFSKQRTWRCYIERDKAVSFPKLWTRSVTSKKTRANPSPKQWIRYCYIEKDKSPWFSE